MTWDSDTIRRFFRYKRTIAALTIIAIFTASAILAPLISPYDPHNINFKSFDPPSAAHWLGTDSYGQDVLSQLIWGSRISIMVGIFAGLLTSIVGTAIGVISGYKKGVLGEVLMRVVDLFLVIPNLILLILLAAFLPNLGTFGEIIIISALGWLWMARSIRAQTLTEGSRDYILAARALGIPDREIMFKELLPNILPVVLANMILVITAAILTEASLSFLGVAGDPTTVSWGRMLALAFTNNAVIYNAWWWTLPPGLCIATLGFSFILLGNAVLDLFARNRGGNVQIQ
ncbi:MAG TPA: ABC transporter permease [Spirochaetia bacterium]|nr:ABC transporter permease [Spirochaetia bacterium]